MEAIFIKDLFFNFVNVYGGAAIFICLILEYIGLPIPGESLMMLLGFTRAGKFEILTSIILAALGTFTGSMIAYTIGYLFGEKVVLKVGKPFHITKDSLDKTSEILKRHDAVYIILCRFIPGARHIVPYLSGISRVGVLKNSFYNLLSGAVWCTTFICLGSFAGRKWQLIGKFVSTYTIMALLLIIFIYVVFKYFNRHKVQILTLSVCAAVLTGLITELAKNELSPLDNTVYGYISKFISGNLTSIMKFISNLGSIYFLSALAVIFITVFFIRRKHRFYGIMIIINLISVLLLNIIFKNIIQRPRPDINQLISVAGYSFPSGHSMISIVFYGYIVYLCSVCIKKPYKQILSVFLILLILAIGISRIYLGVHYASDVIGGFLSGLSWLIIFSTLTNVLRLKLKRKI